LQSINQRPALGKEIATGQDKHPVLMR